MSDAIGYIVGGGLREGLRVRLTIPADQVLKELADKITRDFAE